MEKGNVLETDESDVNMKKFPALDSNVEAKSGIKHIQWKMRAKVKSETAEKMKEIRLP